MHVYMCKVMLLKRILVVNIIIIIAVHKLISIIVVVVLVVTVIVMLRTCPLTFGCFTSARRNTKVVVQRNVNWVQLTTQRLLVCSLQQRRIYGAIYLVTLFTVVVVV